MDKLVIDGGLSLKGEVTISGSKNSVLPILAATLLTDEPCKIKGAPDLEDTVTMLKILRSLGKEAVMERDEIQIIGITSNHIADYELVSKMRASFCVLGPLISKLKKAKVSLPGGCVIGVRPVDLHLKGLSTLGVKLGVVSGYIEADASSLKGRHVYLGGDFGSSVLATDNVMMAAVRAKGKTIIEAAACEPEVTDLANFLIKMGAKIKGHGTPIIEVTGVKELKGTDYKIIPDRIEVGTFILAGLITKGEIIIKNCRPDHLGSLLDILKTMGAHIHCKKDSIRVKGNNSLKPINITTLPYPGFPTDLQAQIMALLSVVKGISVITEKIYPDRFMHVAELDRMGAQIQKEGPHAIIQGVKSLSGTTVMASDLRASAALVLAGLVAKGQTHISRIYHLDRGYEDLEKKFEALGAKIRREKE
ncbi:MAG: UDP-N-acetylglucosamine 1-carboxyvinyltransferase [Candidatus Omnitrophota bacterium]